MPERLRIFISSLGGVVLERRRALLIGALLVVEKLWRKCARFFDIARNRSAYRKTQPGVTEIEAAVAAPVAAGPE